MNKIISIILTLAMLLSMSSFTIIASSDELAIATPADGTTIKNVKTEIKLSNSAADSEFTYEFDGKILNDAVLTQDMLTIGEHTLVVYEEAIDGTIKDAESTFNVIKQLDNIRVTDDFKAYAFSNADLEGSTVNFGDKNSGNYIQFITKRQKKNGDFQYKWKATVSKVTGPEGGSDAAYNMTSEVGNTGGNRPSVAFFYEDPISTIAEVEFDMAVNVNTNIKFIIKAGADGYVSESGKYLFDQTSTSSGTIMGTSCTYEVGKWQHVKYKFKKYADGIYADLYVSSKNFDGQEVVQTVLTNTPVKDTSGNVLNSPITLFSFDYRGGAGMGFSIDNVKVSEAPAFTGIKNIEYMYDAELNSDANPDSSRLTGLKIYMNEPVIAPVPVTVTDKSGNTITISDPTKDTASNAIIAKLPYAQMLTANTEYNVSVSLEANLAGLSDLATKSFKTKADSYAAEEPQFKVGTTKLIKKSQLCGSVLTVDLPIANADTPKPAAFVLAVRDGNKLVGLGILIPDGGVPVGGDTYTLQTGTLPAEMSDVTIQVMYLNDINNISTAFATVSETVN